jgi:uncharacterized protein (TIGR02996 family)
MAKKRPATMHEGFLAAIRENPDDDTPRLIYADWLEEHDEPERAEFIRLQVERATIEGDAGALRHRLAGADPAGGPREEHWFLMGLPPALEDDSPPLFPEKSARREESLLKAHRKRWVEGLPYPIDFRRGFPEVLAVSARDYLQSLAILDRIAPVQAVRLSTSDAEPEEDVDDEEEEQARLDLAEQLAGCPMLERWVELEFVDSPGYEIYEILLNSPHLTNLRRLVAVDNEIGPGVAEVARPNFTQLRWLDLYSSNSAGGRPDDDDFIAIVTSPHLAQLEYINYGSNNASDAGVAVLASSPTMSRLRSLSLSSNDISAEGLRMLALSTSLTSLQHLDLSSCCVNDSPDDSALAVLLESPLFVQLTYLNLRSNRVSDEGVACLARTPAAKHLRTLVIGGQGFGQTEPALSGASVRSLGVSPHLTGLRSLALRQLPLDDELACILAYSTNLQGLRELIAQRGPGLTAKGDEALHKRFGNQLRPFH